MLELAGEAKGGGDPANASNGCIGLVAPGEIERCLERESEGEEEGDFDRRLVAEGEEREPDREMVVLELVAVVRRGSLDSLRVISGFGC